MGASSTDGEISFTGIQLTDTAVLAFRASPYNSAKSMQLDVYANDQLVKSIQETVTQETRNEVRYRITLPASTTSIRLASVGGGTDKRACMQELYLLTPKKNQAIDDVPFCEKARKEIRDGQVIIIRGEKRYTPLGQTIQ